MDATRAPAEEPLSIDAECGPLAGESWWLRAPDGHLFHVSRDTVDVLRAVDGRLGPSRAAARLDLDPQDLMALLATLAAHGAVQPAVGPLLREHRQGMDRLAWWLSAAAALGLAAQAAFFLLAEPTLRLAGLRDAGLALALVLLSVPAHEAAHWLAARRCRGLRLGLTWALIFPTIYVDTHEAWTLPRARRCAVDAAGPVVDIALGGVAAAVALVWPGAAAVVTAFLLTQALRLSLALNPLMPGDGYWLLSDLAGVPNLNQRARESLRALRLHWLSAYAALSYAFAALSLVLLGLFVGGLVIGLLEAA